MLHKKLARIFSNVHYYHYTNALFGELHILKLSDFVQLKTTIIMYEANTKLLPNNIIQQFMTQHMKHDKVIT